MTFVVYLDDNSTKKNLNLVPIETDFVVINLFTNYQ